MAGPVVQGPVINWQYLASLVGFDPTLLICEKKRGVEPPRRNCCCCACRATEQKGCDPFDIPGVLISNCYPVERFYGFRQHSRSGLQLQTSLQLVQRSTCRAANMAVPTAARHFCSAKILAGRAALGDGGPPRRGCSSPAQRNFQRKFALRRVGFHKFVVPPTSNRSKVRNNSRLVRCPYRAAPGCQRDRGPSVSGRVQRNPFQGVPLGNFFAAARHRASSRS